MCGIFAWAGKDPKRFNRNKLNNLGIMNEVRGTHSCGISKDGEIVVGIDGQKLFRDFLAGSGYTNPKKYPAVIGHTRQSTFGAHTIDNAHPFGFGTNQDGAYKLIGVHNGTLLNHPELAKEYDIDTTIKTGVSKTGTQLYRTKIDSEVLLEIISNTENFQVLSKYNGAAALVWTDTNEPNVIYCYHGQSKKRDFDHSEEEIERPLYYYQESKNSLYISSLQSSLFVIGGVAKNVDEFDVNTIYKITDGNVATAEKISISREGRFISGTARSTTNSRPSTTNYRHIRESNARHAMTDETCQVPIRTWRDRVDDKTIEAVQKRAEGSALQAMINSNLYTEAPAENANFYGPKIYMNKLRYWRNGHKVEGIYVYVEGFGFYFVGDSMKQAVDRYYQIINRPFFENDFTDLEEIPKKHKEGAYFPFVYDDVDVKAEKVHPTFYFFYQGIRIRTAGDYFACKTTAEKQLEPFTYEQLSYCSAHPIMDVSKSFMAYDSQGILWDGVFVTDTISPLGAEKVYQFINGNCVSRETIRNHRLLCEKKTRKLAENETPNQTKMELVVNNLQNIEDEIKKKEKEDALVVSPNGHLNDLLESDLDYMFKDALQKFPSYIKRLDRYSDPKAIKARTILKRVVQEATSLITIEIKE